MHMLSPGAAPAAGEGVEEIFAHDISAAGQIDPPHDDESPMGRSAESLRIDNQRIENNRIDHGECSPSSTDEFHEIQPSFFTEYERRHETLRERVRRALHEQRMHELLQARSGVSTFHKFSLVCPAHLVCLVMCFWLCITSSFMVLAVELQQIEVVQLRMRILRLEYNMGHNRTQNVTQNFTRNLTRNLARNLARNLTRNPTLDSLSLHR